MRLHPADNVAVLVDAPAPAGTRVEVEGVAAFSLKNEVPKGHKVALADVAAGGPVIKFAQLIGVASKPIAQGEHAHVHNVAMPSEEQSNTHFANRPATAA